VSVIEIRLEPLPATQVLEIVKILC